MKKQAIIVGLMIMALGCGSVYGQCYYPYPSGSGCICINSTEGYVICEAGSPSCTLITECGVAAGCFLSGTLIETTKGLRPIEDIKVGDYLVGLEKGGSLINSLVLDTHKYLQNKYLLVNGVIEVSTSHPFLLNGEWREAGEIELGDHLMNRKGELITVSSIERINKGVRVYNVSLGSNHTFLANGILVHNKPPRPGG